MREFEEELWSERFCCVRSDAIWKERLSISFFLSREREREGEHEVGVNCSYGTICGGECYMPLHSR